jgi:hypothetical protein
MYNIIRESITSPKELIKYHRKKGWFVFLYLFIFAIFMSLNIILVVVANNNPTINDEVTDCQSIGGSFVCQETPIDDQNYVLYEDTIFAIDMYFLSDSQSLDDVEPSNTTNQLVVKDDTAYFHIYNTQTFELDVRDFESTGQLVSVIKTSMAASMILFSIVESLLVILFIVLLSTLPFLRFKKHIRYKKIFKMVAFAATPIYIILMIRNLLNFDTFIFFILMFIGYRSIFVLQKELYIRSLIHEQNKRQQSHQQPSQDNVIDQEEDDE